MMQLDEIVDTVVRGRKAFGNNFPDWKRSRTDLYELMMKDPEFDRIKGLAKEKGISDYWVNRRVQDILDYRLQNAQKAHDWLYGLERTVLTLGIPTGKLPKGLRAIPQRFGMLLGRIPAAPVYAVLGKVNNYIDGAIANMYGGYDEGIKGGLEYTMDFNLTGDAEVLSDMAGAGDLFRKIGLPDFKRRMADAGLRDLRYMVEHNGQVKNRPGRGIFDRILSSLPGMEKSEMPPLVKYATSPVYVEDLSRTCP